MVRKKIIKTVLAPGAPWPKYEAPEEKTKQKRPPRPSIEGSRRKNTDAQFELWAAKHIGVIE